MNERLERRRRYTELLRGAVQEAFLDENLRLDQQSQAVNYALRLIFNRAMFFSRFSRASDMPFEMAVEIPSMELQKAGFFVPREGLSGERTSLKLTFADNELRMVESYFRTEGPFEQEYRTDTGYRDITKEFVLWRGSNNDHWIRPESFKETNIGQVTIAKDDAPEFYKKISGKKSVRG